MVCIFTMSDTLCVHCRRQTVDTLWQPFCSERCKLLDLRNWVDERYRVPAEKDPSLPGPERMDNDRSDS